MKNQYFGDIRDLFKYDLIEQILKKMSSLQGCTLIPMLTKNENALKKGEGNKRNFDRAKKGGRPGTSNKELMKFLEKYKEKEIDRDKRDFTEIEKYFKLRNIEIDIYKGREYFDYGTRDEYFKNIPEKFLRKHLVFVDPDIGLQIKNSTKKHLLCSEVKELYSHMDEGSILLIYQHLPRVPDKYPEYSSEGRSNKLEKETGNLPMYISDNEITFFLLTKNDELKSKLERVISKYKRDYPKRIIIGNVNYNGT